MKSSYMCAYVIGSDKAVKFYQEAFDAVLTYSSLNDDGTFFMAVLDIQGQSLGVAERNKDNAAQFAIQGETITGNTMQYCLVYGEGNEDKIRKAYDVLKTDAKILIPPQSFDHTSLCVDLIDKFGVRWCLYI